MRTLLRGTIFSVAVVSVLWTSLSTVAVAQQAAVSPSANAKRFGIAVVDVNYIFKNYSQFKTAMEAIKIDIQQAEVKLKAVREGIQAKEAQAKDYQPSSPEFKQLDEDLARLKADFNIKAGRTRKDFQEREAKVYYQTYLQVSSTVHRYAQQNNIGLVLKFNGDKINPDRPEAILKAINKPVVSQNNIDITPDVLALLNRGGSPGGVAPAASRGVQQRR
ncbi:MAG: OmpH family outer membrane protein [Planctomycetes bacterium]|nr:OmpH family outer membrane protein [Planctomycetota bacterium]